MGFLRWCGRFLREHWKGFSLLGLAVAAGVTVGLLVFFFPPALPAIGFFTILGVTPFLPVMGLSLPTAAAVCAGGAAALTVIAGGIFNAVVGVTNFLDFLIRGSKKPADPDPDLSPESHYEGDDDEDITAFLGKNGFNYSKGDKPKPAGSIFTDPSQSRKPAGGTDPDLVSEASAPRVN